MRSNVLDTNINQVSRQQIRFEQKPETEAVKPEVENMFLLYGTDWSIYGGSCF